MQSNPDTISSQQMIKATMSLFLQQEVNTMLSTMDSNQIPATYYEPMTKRRRIVGVNNNYSARAYPIIDPPLSSSISASTSIMPIIESQFIHRRKLKVVGRRRNANTTTSIITPTSSRVAGAQDDLSVEDLVKPMEHLSINCPLSRSTTPRSSNLPLELQKQSLGGLVDRFAQMDIKDDGADDDGDLLMEDVSSILLSEPVYHFGVEEKEVHSFRNLIELTPTQKLRRHRQRRQELMKKRQNKYKFTSKR